MSDPNNFWKAFFILQFRRSWARFAKSKIMPVPNTTPPNSDAAPTLRRIKAGHLTLTYPAGKGNLSPPMHLLNLLGTLSDPQRDREYPQFSNISGLGYVGGVGLVLGMLLGVHFLGLLLSVFYFHSLPLSRWCLYVVSLTSFHALEFLVTARYNPRTATAESYLITHSKAYTIAAVASWAEFWLETLLLTPSITPVTGYFGGFVLLVGAVLVIGGQALRSLGMITAGSSFNHIVQDEHDGNQVLVTHGVYQTLRHPAYFGWFWWSVGTQIVLMNPICICAYAYASWKFFQNRIPYEEAALIKMFGEKYVDYRKRTMIGIPFIKV